jgi:hypothetical protein
MALGRRAIPMHLRGRERGDLRKTFFYDSFFLRWSAGLSFFLYFVRTQATISQKGKQTPSTRSSFRRRRSKNATVLELCGNLFGMSGGIIIGNGEKARDQDRE